MYCFMCRLDGQVDVVDGPKLIKSKEVSSTKLDTNTRTDLQINKNLGKKVNLH